MTKSESKNSLKKKAKEICLLISDVDGVLTDGGMYYTGDGNFMKRFNVKDGMAVSLLKNAGIQCGILTSDNSPVNEARGRRLDMDLIFTAIENKKIKLLEICDQLRIKPSNIAYIGDDIGDIETLKLAGFSACPSDAIAEVRKVVDYVCIQPGGHGAFREVADLLISFIK